MDGIIVGNRSRGCVAIRFSRRITRRSSERSHFSPVDRTYILGGWPDLVFRTSQSSRSRFGSRACQRLISEKLPRREQDVAFSHAPTTRLSFRGRGARAREKTVFPASPWLQRKKRKSPRRKREGRSGRWTFAYHPRVFASVCCVLEEARANLVEMAYLQIVQIRSTVITHLRGSATTSKRSEAKSPSSSKLCNLYNFSFTRTRQDFPLWNLLT